MKIFNLDIVELVNLAVSYADKKYTWSEAWALAYQDLGGTKESCSRKPCPRAGAKALYELGLLRSSPKAVSLISEDAVGNMPKNGWYCYLALRELKKDPTIEHAELWTKVRNKILERFGNAPKRDEGSVKIAMALYQADQVNVDQIS